LPQGPGKLSKKNATRTQAGGQGRQTRIYRHRPSGKEKKTGIKGKNWKKARRKVRPETEPIRERYNVKKKKTSTDTEEPGGGPGEEEQQGQGGGGDNPKENDFTSNKRNKREGGSLTRRKKWKAGRTITACPRQEKKIKYKKKGTACLHWGDLRSFRE